MGTRAKGVRAQVPSRREPWIRGLTGARCRWVGVGRPWLGTGTSNAASPKEFSVAYVCITSVDCHVGSTGDVLGTRNREMEAGIWELASAGPKGNKPVFL